MEAHTQNAIWAWIHTHQWWWTVIQLMCLLITLRILRLAPAVTLWGRLVRMVLVAGLMCYTASYWNSALSVPGLFLILVGLWLWVEQLISQCLRAGHIKHLAMPTWGFPVKAPQRAR